MSAELYDHYANMMRIDQAIFDAEKELNNGGKVIDEEDAFMKPDAKFYG